jgi:TldD protein
MAVRLINMKGDRTQKDGLATRGFDDDGVKTTEWDIIKDGKFVGYQTTREMAKFIGESASNGCAYADSWDHFPIQRMPNVSLMPGKKKLSLNDLIADTEDGIFISKAAEAGQLICRDITSSSPGRNFGKLKTAKLQGMLKRCSLPGQHS